MHLPRSQAIPPELVKWLKANHAQIVDRFRATMLPSDQNGVAQGLRHSWESPSPASWTRFGSTP